MLFVCVAKPIVTELAQLKLPVIVGFSSIALSNSDYAPESIQEKFAVGSLKSAAKAVVFSGLIHGVPISLDKDKKKCAAYFLVDWGLRGIVSAVDYHCNASAIIDSKYYSMDDGLGKVFLGGVICFSPVIKECILHYIASSNDYLNRRDE